MDNKNILLGELGSKIDANVIFKNLLDKTEEIAKGIWDPFEFKALVTDFGDWDLKNNIGTIYGIANLKENKGSYFIFGDRAMEPQDIGNFHYGFAGLATGLFPKYMLEQQAGQNQIDKGLSRPEWQNGIFTPFTWPYGDDPTDNYYINRGFEYYEKPRW